MNLATFVIALVPGQASIVHIGVRDIGADVMVVVPLESRGGEDKEGEKNDALSAAASFGFEASLPSAQYSQSVASNDGAGGGPLILPEVTESGASSSSVRRSPVHWGLPKLDLVPKMFRLSMLGRLSHIEDAMHDTTLSTRPTAESVHNMPFTKGRLKTSKLAKSDDALLTAALKKLRIMVLFWPEDGRLGRTFLSSAGAVVGEDILQQSLRDCFAGKAVATLVKGVPDFTRFAEFQVSCNNGSPLNQSEHDWYDYLCYLRQQGAGATEGGSFISAWKFMQNTVGAGANGTDIISGRVRGTSEDLMAKKRKLQQALPLPAEIVWELEGLMTKRIQPKMNATLGFILFCMFSCSRFADAARAHRLVISQFRHIISVKSASSEYKTASGERWSILLPLVALGTAHDQDQCVMHQLSGIVHGKETTDTLLCGRALSTNRRPVESPWSERDAHEFCEQCNRALHRA